MKLITAPNSYKLDHFCVFLAGSIESDKAERWQETIINALKDNAITILNPRRASWDNSWEQSINNTEFKEQVNWELMGLEQCDMVIMYFDPSTKSPISLLELGLFAQSGKLVVCCPDGFWRKGNVDVVCKRYTVDQVDSLEELINKIKTKLI
ncbi:nucleoside 2-deoxyribosyltransferase domain-containing protein [Spongiivirga citrea]|uniref:Nucleoside 2-deoxyribosyltransferase n=1 Tax=Spongiivirga citrea TaxID=1481457 RepID=A0A6M0CRU5_9FLAO|nr:nucleoside 2-deoxyribosyltransferase domain-containing protein [Spongiivirga citrea]NER16630.1 hypothetical protein [Spongiivirga citrea]